MSEEGKVEAKKEDEAKPGAASLIPEVYYDLIARVPAGTLLVLVVVNSYLRAKGLSLPQASTWFTGNSVPVLVIAGAVMGLGGLTGIVISPMANRFRDIYWKRAWLGVTAKGPYSHLDQILEEVGYAGLPKRSDWYALSAADFHGLDRWMYDYVQEQNSAARTLLPKLRAEADFCSYLAAACFLLPILRELLSLALPLFLSSKGPAVVPAIENQLLAWCVASWTITVLLCFSGAYRTKRLLLRMLSMFWIIVSRERIRVSASPIVEKGKTVLEISRT